VLSLEEAQRLQQELRGQVELTSHLAWPVRLVAGFDVSYEVGSDRVVAAAVVVELSTLATVEVATVEGAVRFPYVPGLLGFRETPFVLDAFGRLGTRPEVLVCDGYGIAHPRRFGLASHVGVETGLPTFGVAKAPNTLTFAEPGTQRGAWSPLYDGTEVLGRALRTQTGVKPVFVSVGHRVSLDEATELTLALSPRYRLPEVIRRADALSRAELRR
jgi:deoxyribonuclease V